MLWKAATMNLYSRSLNWGASSDILEVGERDWIKVVLKMNVFEGEWFRKDLPVQDGLTFTGVAMMEVIFWGCGVRRRRENDADRRRIYDAQRCLCLCLCLPVGCRARCQPWEESE